MIYDGQQIIVGDAQPDKASSRKDYMTLDMLRQFVYESASLAGDTVIEAAELQQVHDSNTWYKLCRLRLVKWKEQSIIVQLSQ